MLLPPHPPPVGGPVDRGLLLPRPRQSLGPCFGRQYRGAPTARDALRFGPCWRGAVAVCTEKHHGSTRVLAAGNSACNRTRRTRPPRGGGRGGRNGPAPRSRGQCSGLWGGGPGRG